VEVKEKQRTRVVLYIAIGLFAVALPLIVPSPIVDLLTKIFIFALLTMSLDFLVGYAGLWSFCQAALFGVAAYTTGILITHYGIRGFGLTAPASLLTAMFVSAIIGFIALRVSEIYFLLITLALGQLVYGVVLRWKAMTKGPMGLVGLPYPGLGFSWDSRIGMYYFVLAFFIICALLLYLITNSPFGVSLQGIRQSEVRMRILGYNTWLYQYVAFVISGLFAGVAGVWYAHYNGLITPEDIDVSASGFLWLVLIVGGTGTLWGALIGSAVILSLEYVISILTPERWPLIVGACFIASVMFFRGGIFPYLVGIWVKAQKFHAKS
jgi:branched-chain amino acid transport system permease protein